MRVGFVTCVELGLECLEAIAADGGRFAFAMTLPDDSARDKSGRVRLDDFCARTATPLHKVANINDPASLAILSEASLDWLLIIGWSQIARAPVLGAARLGTLGMHPTLLPAGRGRASIPWAILKGLSETGVTLFQLDEGVDSGPIAAQMRIPVDPAETATTLYRKVARAHVELLRAAWQNMLRGELRLQVQDHTLATVWPGRRPDDGRIDAVGSVADAERLIRAVTHPYPGAFYSVARGRIRVWSAVLEPEKAGGAPGFDPDTARMRFSDGSLRLLDWRFEDG
jgi:methionyl-tRNA formyltransferase